MYACLADPGQHLLRLVGDERVTEPQKLLAMLSLATFPGN